MPYVSIETNVPEASVPADFLKIMTSSAAATIGKDESVSRIDWLHIYSQNVSRKSLLAY